MKVCVCDMSSFFLLLLLQFGLEFTPRGGREEIYIYICSFEHQKSDNKERIARSSLSSGENTAQTTKRTHTLAARKEKTHTEKKKNELRARTLGHFCVVFFALV